jgi:hypothetical protein
MQPNVTLLGLGGPPLPAGSATFRGITQFIPGGPPLSTPSTIALAELAAGPNRGVTQIGNTRDVYGGLITVVPPTPLRLLGALPGTTTLSPTARFLQALQAAQVQSPSRVQQALRDASAQLRAAAQQPSPSYGFGGLAALAHNFARAADTGQLSEVIHVSVGPNLSYYTTRALSSYARYGGASSPASTIGHLLSGGSSAPGLSAFSALGPAPSTLGYPSTSSSFGHGFGQGPGQGFGQGFGQGPGSSGASSYGSSTSSAPPVGGAASAPGLGGTTTG